MSHILLVKIEMKKIEAVYRDILHTFFTERKLLFRQKDLAEKLSCSVSTVFHALEAPRRIGAIRVTGRNFSLTDAEKLLTYWATRRNLSRDVLYETHAPGSAAQREGLMPPEIIFGACSAYRMLFGETPADYEKVIVYAASADPVRARFPKLKGPANIMALQADPLLASYGATTPPVQIFVDLWNLPDWYAQDFRKALWRRLAKEG